MMGAALTIQSAIVAKLEQYASLTGVYHDAPARALFPYAVLSCSNEKDWSCKGRIGREISVQITLWDEQPSRLLMLEDEVDLRVGMLMASSEWHLSSLVATGKKRSRNPAGPWSCTMDLRARLLARSGGPMQ